MSLKVDSAPVLVLTDADPHFRNVDVNIRTSAPEGRGTAGHYDRQSK